jgi:hypothetical protein
MACHIKTTSGLRALRRSPFPNLFKGPFNGSVIDTLFNQTPRRWFRGLTEGSYLLAGFRQSGAAERTFQKGQIVFGFGKLQGEVLPKRQRPMRSSLKG